MGLKSSSVLFLYALSALLGTGYALSCKTCINTYNQYCQGPSMDCPADNACASSYTVTYIDGSPIIKVFSMGCVPKSQCGTSGSASIPNGKTKIKINCCQTNNCTPATPTLPEDNDRRNGQTCQTCGSVSSDNCYTGETMKCTGDETMCLLQSTVQSAPISQSSAVRGCATESMCNLRTQRIEFGELNMKLKFVCTDGSVGLQGSLLLCITVALSVLKLLQSI